MMHSAALAANSQHATASHRGGAEAAGALEAAAISVKALRF